jgi:hypothetical protein
MDRSHRHVAAQSTDFWLARGAILVIVLLQIGIVNDLAVGPHWLAPGLELALLVPLSAATAWTQRRARGASTDAQWNLHLDEFRRAHSLDRCDLGWACGRRQGVAAGCRKYLGHERGRLCALVLVARSRGPAARGLISENKSDFLFTQQQAGVVDRDQFKDWSPGFIDYLFLAFTNATAFSPADTFPLTSRAKLLMMAEAAISLCTIAIVASRAVGILS